MIQRAGMASFFLPDDWQDHSIYTYYSPDQFSKIVLFFEDFPERPDAEAILREKLSEMEEVSPDLNIVQPISDLRVGENNGKVVVFDIKDDEIQRTRFVVLVLQKDIAMIIMAQAPLDDWRKIESVWNKFTSNFSLAEYKR